MLHAVVTRPLLGYNKGRGSTRERKKNEQRAIKKQPLLSVSVVSRSVGHIFHRLVFHSEKIY